MNIKPLTRKEFIEGVYLKDLQWMLRDKEFVKEFKPHGVSWNTVNEFVESTSEEQLLEFIGLGDLETEYEEWQEAVWSNVDYDDRSDLE